MLRKFRTVRTPAAGTRKSRRLRTRHLVALIVSLVVICGGAYAIVVYHTYASTKPAVEAANTFLNSLETNNVADAYTQLCSETRKQFTEAQFAAYVKSQPGIDGHSSTSAELNSVNGQDTAIVTEDIKDSGGSTQTRGIVVAHEGGTWLVCGQPY